MAQVSARRHWRIADDLMQSNGSRDLACQALGKESTT
jgi:hypothetical protein